MTGFEVIEVNGQPAALVTAGGETQLVALAARDGRIAELYAVRNPDKLQRLARP